MAEQFGVPVESRKGRQLVESIKPLRKEEALPKSLSAMFGTGSFPMHTETAHWPVPCRYMFLFCANKGEGKRPTLLLDSRRIRFNKTELQIMKSGIFLFRNSRNSFYSNVISSHSDFFRFDPGCMEPMNDAATEALRIMNCKISKEKLIKINWHVGDLLILNNWTMLHGRAGNNKDDQNRELLRILITNSVKDGQ